MIALVIVPLGCDMAGGFPCTVTREWGVSPHCEQPTELHAFILTLMLSLVRSWKGCALRVSIDTSHSFWAPLLQTTGAKRP